MTRTLVLVLQNWMIIYHSHCGLMFWLVIMLLFAVHHYMWDCCWCICCFLVCLLMKVLMKMYVWVKNHWLEDHFFRLFFYFLFMFLEDEWCEMMVDKWLEAKWRITVACDSLIVWVLPCFVLFMSFQHYFHSIC